MDNSRLDTPQSINMKLNSTLPDSNFSKNRSYDIMIVSNGSITHSTEYIDNKFVFVLVLKYISQFDMLYLVNSVC